MPKHCSAHGRPTTAFRKMCHIPEKRLWENGLREFYEEVDWPVMSEDKAELLSAAERLLLFATDEKNQQALTKIQTLVLHFRSLGKTPATAAFIVVTQQCCQNDPYVPLLHLPYLPMTLLGAEDSPGPPEPESR